MTVAGESTILIVDDEPEIVDYLVQVLIGLGYRTCSASNGAEALGIVDAEPPDLVLLDLIMPVMDGFTVCRRLKEREATRLIPVVVMTALDGIDSRIKAIELGADDVLVKPVNHRELIARIQTALRRKHDVDRRMSALSRIRDHFAKFVPETVRRSVPGTPGAPDPAKRERDVSVVFVDISRYGSLSEHVPPATLNALVERYFSGFLDRITDAGGDINETAGDGFMAIFEDADPAAHPQRAADTALLLLGVTEALNVQEREYPLSIHIGINSGSALVGFTRFEGRRGTRWTFTASGLVTTVAARLAAAAGEQEILVGAETVRRLAGRYRLEPVGRERLKNISEAVEISRLVGPSSHW